MSSIPPIPPVPQISPDVLRRAADQLTASRGEGIYKRQPSFQDRLAARTARELARKVSL